MVKELNLSKIIGINHPREYNCVCFQRRTVCEHDGTVVEPGKLDALFHFNFPRSNFVRYYEASTKRDYPT
jgi:hypothetical protein